MLFSLSLYQRIKKGENYWPIHILFSFLMILFFVRKFRVFLLTPLERDVKFFLKPLQVFLFQFNECWRSGVSSNISQAKNLWVNHRSKTIKGPLPAWFTNEHSAAFDHIYPRKMNLPYFRIFNFVTFSLFWFSSSSKTSNQLV